MNSRATGKPAILSNEKLGISGNKLLEKQALSDLHRDVIALLILGGASVSEEVARILAKCEIGNYLGDPDKPREIHQTTLYLGQSYYRWCSSQ